MMKVCQFCLSVQSPIENVKQIDLHGSLRQFSEIVTVCSIIQSSQGENYPHYYGLKYCNTR